MIKLTTKIFCSLQPRTRLQKKQNKSTQARTGHGPSGCLRGLVLRCFFIGVEAAAGAVLPPLRRNRLKYSGRDCKLRGGRLRLQSIRRCARLSGLNFGGAVMIDSATIGTLVASALAMAGDAMVKGLVGEAVKDGYKSLKNKVAAWAADDVEALEKAPTSQARQAVVAEIIDIRQADDKAAVRALATQLIDALKRAGAGAVGLDVGRLDAIEVQLGAINVTEGTGARIDEARVRGTFQVGDINVGGQPSGKS